MRSSSSIFSAFLSKTREAAIRRFTSTYSTVLRRRGERTHDARIARNGGSSLNRARVCALQFGDYDGLSAHLIQRSSDRSFSWMRECSPTRWFMQSRRTTLGFWAVYLVEYT